MSVINNFFQIINRKINSSKKADIPTVSLSTLEKCRNDDEKLTVTLDALASMNTNTVKPRPMKAIEPDTEYLGAIVNKYGRRKSDIEEDKEKITAHLTMVSNNLEAQAMEVSIDEAPDILAKKAVVDYVKENVRYNDDFMEGNIGFKFGFPTGEVDGLRGFEDEFTKSQKLFKKEGIFDLSQYDMKKHQYDAEQIMQKYQNKAHRNNSYDYNKLFNPIERLRQSFCQDAYLTEDANFYRIISPAELKELLKTKQTGKYIDSYGHYTTGHYSCITTNPNYNEQAFAANGIPIRLKFKTKENGEYNMDLMNRIAGIKPERSIYGVGGYNYYDIDWNNVCVDTGADWVRLSKEDIDDLTQQILGQSAE